MKVVMELLSAVAKAIGIVVFIAIYIGFILFTCLMSIACIDLCFRRVLEYWDYLF